ncbi:Aste57867_4344 [Aphanomyces stellatus]|uniref:Aste57867_4344 protein n=1 Tax=Aphanomyces stellatus TaxID=120398 RepID=A0A485KGP3_9STRA|nr:hypothetical protein As57867_004332 [Aphanomyces stellatus]VFT81458.1 Aste57867_4344 [Aphanomyces stellatus]
MELAAPLLLPTRRGVDRDDDGGGASKAKKYHLQRDGEQLKNTWVDSMFIVVANVVGIGVLGLAHAFATLGWVYVVLFIVILCHMLCRWGILCLGGTLAGSLYSGLLMTRMKCRVPHAVAYADLGYEAFGNLGKAFVTLFGYTYITGVCFSFQLTASLFLKELTNGLCFVYCAILVAAVVLPLAQYRNFAEMNGIAVVGALSILVPVLLILVDIVWMGRVQPAAAAAATTSWGNHAPFDTSVVACMDVIFAMAGHVFFVEIMSEMHNPSDFTKSLVAATSLFAIVYFVMAVVGYAALGAAVATPITDNLANAVTRRWCAAFILCHIVVAYVMAVMVLARAVEQRVFHRAAEQSKHASVANRVSWLAITASIVVASFLVSNVLPFVNDLLGFVGAISGVTTTFVFPFLFAPVLLGNELTSLHARALQAVAILSSLVAVVGVTSSVHRMAHSYQTRAPFSC